MSTTDFTVLIKVRGPVLTQATSAGGLGIDAPAARLNHGPHRGAPYLPGTLIKGRLRDAWSELSDVDPRFKAAVQLLGDVSDKPHQGANPGVPLNTNHPYRGGLVFSDFACTTYDSATRSGTTYRVRIDEQRGAADEGALQLIETPIAPGIEATFHGTVTFLHATTMAAKDLEDLRHGIAAGLAWCPSLGGERSGGFGRVLSVQVSRSRAAVRVQDFTKTCHAVSGIPWLDLTIVPDRPFCLAKRRTKPNIFESEISISGAALRGCIVSMLNLALGRAAATEVTAYCGQNTPYEALCKHFDSIRFVAAHPAPANQPQRRPVVPPLSLVHCPLGVSAQNVYPEGFADVALRGPSVLTRSNKEGEREFAAPAFQVDWKGKQFSECFGAFGWGHPSTELRVRTAIDADRRRAKDEHLFAYETVIPDGCVWRGGIELHGVADGERAGVASALLALLEAFPAADGAALSARLHLLGKTKASADVAVVPGRFPAAMAPSSLDPIPSPDGDVWVVTLQSNALLSDPSKTTAAELADEYRRVWREISNNTLTLIRYFATQTMMGGYLVYRHQGNKNAYKPFLLTEAGSTFVLRAADGVPPEKARTEVEIWLARGLPLPGWAEQGYGDSYMSNPFRPRDGFGEIAVNLGVHQAGPPAGSEWVPVKGVTP